MKLILTAVAAALILIPAAGATGGGEGEHEKDHDHGTPVSCPEGTVQISEKGPLVCLKTVTETVTNTVTNTVTVTNDVPGPTVYVDKIVTVDRPVPGPTVTVTQIKWKTPKVKVVHRTIIKVKVKKIPQVGVCKRPGGGVAVQGAG
jgi:hypothetical protein